MVWVRATVLVWTVVGLGGVLLDGGAVIGGRRALALVTLLPLVL